MTTLGLTGGRVLRPDLTVERADVLVDVEEGEIRAVETGLDGDETLDASGGLVTPGFVNAHTHVAMTLLRGYADDKPLDAWLQEDIWPVEAALEPEDVHAGAKLGVLEMIRSGTTAFADMYFHVPEIAAAVGEAGLRAVLGHTAITVGKDDAAAREDIEQSIETAERLDGAADGRITTTVQPHSLTTVGERWLDELAAGASEIDAPLHFHANETTNEVEPIVAEHQQRPLAFAAEQGLLREDTWVAHGVHLDDTEIDLLAEHGTAVAHCPSANMKLASGMAPVQRLLDASVTVGLGTDGPASNNDLDMLGEMTQAALLGKLASDDASAVAAPTVVEMATAGGADALGLNAGRIEPGRAADLAVIDCEQPHLTPAHDLVSHLAYAARGSDVRHTVCDGAVLMEDREVQSLDATAVRERASDRAAALLERAGQASA
jgi:5-methylthioadenosine/S-adenosylhomocysteine deaminase